MKPNFSETQFVFGYVNELYFTQQSHPSGIPPWLYFRFPSTLMERKFPVDFFVQYYNHSEFYQFKRSHHFGRRRGKREIDEGVPLSYLDYYRFEIYNRTTSTQLGQFEKLLQLASQFSSDLVCYCAPCFHEDWEFYNHFNNRSIIENSIIIECNQFNSSQFQPPNFNINDGLKHFLAYKLNSSIGYLCSEPKEINIFSGKNKSEYYQQTKGAESFKKTLDTLYNQFYLRDELEGNFEKVETDDAKKIYLIGRHLLQYYNIIWLPIYSLNQYRKS